MPKVYQGEARALALSSVLSISLVRPPQSNLRGGLGT